jgi:hypothetical protein
MEHDMKTVSLETIIQGVLEGPKEGRYEYFKQLSEIAVRERWSRAEVLNVVSLITDSYCRAYFLYHLRKACSQEETSDSQNAVPRSAQFALLLIPKRNREHLVGDLEE